MPGAYESLKMSMRSDSRTRSGPGLKVVNASPWGGGCQPSLARLRVSDARTKQVYHRAPLTPPALDNVLSHRTAFKLDRGRP